MSTAMLIADRPASAAATNSISQFGSLTNAMMAYGSSANREKIAGRTTVASVDRPFVHSASVLTPLGTLPGFTRAQAYDVNDAGQVVGWATNSAFGFGFDQGERAFVFSGGTMTQLPVLSSTGFTHAFAINNAGTIVGVSARNRAFKFNIGDAALTALPFPAGGSGFGKAYDINTAGDIVGFEYTRGLNPTQRPVFWDGGVTPTALPMPAGATSAEVNVINDAGVVAGVAFYGAGNGSRPYYYDDAAGAPVDMGTLGPGYVGAEVFDINGSFDAIGTSFNNQTFAIVPFLYRDGTMVNLNSLLPAGSGWVLQRPISINDAGEIIGIGTFNGTRSGFKLTPIPEPAALAGVAMMTLAAVLRRRRRHRHP
jgi:probable HAF family extracellular repeat protein